MRKTIKFSAIFFLGLSLTVACKKKANDFGLNVQPQEDALNVNQSDTTSLLTYTVKEDSIKSDEITGPNMLGSYVDPIFGEMQASIYAHLRIESAYDFRPAGGSLSDLVIDSAVMYLEIDGLYGANTEQTFQIHQLENNIYLDSTYYTTSTVAVKNTNLILGSGKIKPNMGGIGFVGGDTVSISILRLPLDVQNFAWPIANESGNPSLAGNDGSGAFVDWFKGVRISVDDNHPVGKGAILYADLISSNSKVMIFYRDTVQNKSFKFNLHFNANCARFHNININYSGTQVEAAIADTVIGQESFYTQSLGGCKAKIALPFLSKNSGKKVINKAELILPIQYYALDYFIPGPKHYLLRSDSTGADLFLPDFTEGSGGILDLSTNTIRFNITRYINGIISGKYKNYPLTLLSTGSGVSAYRTIFNGAQSTNKEKPRLLITYTNY